MQNLAFEIKACLSERGAALVGFADLTMLPENEQRGMPFGISIAVLYQKDTIRGIDEYPTKNYYDEYHALNKKLDALGTLCAEMIRKAGYDALAQTTDVVEWDTKSFVSTFPHKTVARLSGLGWIGKSALLVTPEFGSMVRFTSVLTNAPVEVATPVDKSRCGDCMICTKACPAGAIKGAGWSPGVPRDDIFDAEKCYITARERSKTGYGICETICGRCINVCPYTQRYLKEG